MLKQSEENSRLQTSFGSGSSAPVDLNHTKPLAPMPLPEFALEISPTSDDEDSSALQETKELPLHPSEDTTDVEPPDSSSREIKVETKNRLLSVEQAVPVASMVCLGRNNILVA